MDLRRYVLVILFSARPVKVPAPELDFSGGNVLLEPSRIGDVASDAIYFLGAGVGFSIPRKPSIAAVGADVAIHKI